MKAVTARQIQRLDEVAIHTFGIPSVVLMENAGRRVFEEITRRGRLKRVCVMCGQGNNAGDGFVVARHLADADIPVEIIMPGPAERLKPDALLNYQLARRMRIRVHQIKRVTPKVAAVIGAADLTLDAIFGVGLNRTVTGLLAEMITAINDHASRTVAVDIPSGLDATTGRVYGVCVKARQTVTFTFPKTGFTRGQGPAQTGTVKVVGIGIPRLIKDRVIK